MLLPLLANLIQKTTAATSRGSLATARLSCVVFVCERPNPLAYAWGDNTAVSCSLATAFNELLDQASVKLIVYASFSSVEARRCSVSPSGE